MRRVLLSVMVVCLCLAQVPRLSAAAASNLVSLALVPEWEAVCQQLAPPRCAAAPGATRYAGWALRLSSRYERALANVGRAAWLEGDCSEAREAWQQALLIAPQDSATAFWLFWAVGADVSGLAAALPAEALAEHALRASQRAKTAGAEEAAIAWLELAFDLAPGRRAAGGLAPLYQRAGRLEEVAAVWEGVAQALPDGSADHWWAVGQLAELTRDWEAAAQAYNRGAVLAGEPYEFWVREGSALLHLQQWDAAEEAYRRALTCRAARHDPYLGLGQVWFARQDYSRSWAWYALAQALAPHNHAVLYHLSQSLYRLGEIQQAADVLARAIDFHARQPWWWAVMLGDWRSELGDREGALDAYRLALEWQPGEPIIETRIERVLGQ